MRVIERFLVSFHNFVAKNREINFTQNWVDGKKFALHSKFLIFSSLLHSLVLEWYKFREFKGFSTLFCISYAFKKFLYLCSKMMGNSHIRLCPSLSFTKHYQPYFTKCVQTANVILIFRQNGAGEYLTLNFLNVIGDKH